MNISFCFVHDRIETPDGYIQMRVEGGAIRLFEILGRQCTHKPCDRCVTQPRLFEKGEGDGGHY